MPAWGPIAAIAAPIVAGAFNKRPRYPGYQGRVPVYTPEEEAYYNQFLESSFSPQSDIYRLAQESAIDMTNRNMARRGLGASSLAMQQDRTIMSDLANKFLQDELNRRAMGMKAIQGRIGLETGQAGKQYSADMGRYQDQVGRGTSFVGGIGDAASAYLRYQGQQNQRDAINQQTDALRQYASIFPQYGTSQIGGR
jgi:hypothetical protein